jgi:phosphoglycerol transferase MdoB-like AlkP superfamily enzyme
MNNDILNKKTAIGLVVIMIIYFIIKIANPLIFSYYVDNIDPSLYTKELAYQSWIKLIHNVFMRGASIAVGVFLIFEAKRANYNRLLWFCLGATFGLITLILFYIYRIYENTKPNRNDNSATNIN